MTKKKKVLFLTEATYLSTGYATYYREIMNIIYDSNKYEIAELATYGIETDENVKKVRWKFYPNMPIGEEQKKMYDASPIHQFGSWRFERTCLDFKPDIVIDIRDPWQSSWVKASPFRRIFKWAWMPTVDARFIPHNQEWVDSIFNADGVFTYSQFGLNELKKVGIQNNLIGVASPAASSVYHPVANKTNHKAQFGLDPHCKIVGTVMRNQKRKLFPALFKAFKKHLESTKSNSYLYCHTSYPDRGWNLDKLLIDSGISSRVLFTYLCDECGHYGPSKFSDIVKMCPNCKKISSRTYSVGKSIPPESLNNIFNLFDMYIQPATGEGFGVPIVEAASCGLPIAVTDYSAMEDFKDTLGARPIKVSGFYHEIETGRDWAVTDIDDMEQAITETLSLPSEIIRRKGMETREMFLKNYSWEKTAKQWTDFIDSQDFADWEIQPKFSNPPQEIPQFNNYKDFVNWAYKTHIALDDFIGSYEYIYILKCLNQQSIRANADSVPQQFTPDVLLANLKARAERDNLWEKARIGQMPLTYESWLKC